MRAPRQTKWLDRFLVVRLAGAGTVARRELDRACRRVEVPLRDVLVLAVVSDHPKVTSSEAARKLGLQRSEVTRVVHELVYDGMVDEGESLDGRSTTLRLLPAGESLLRQAEPAVGAVDKEARRHLTRTRERQLAACLTALRGPTSPVAEALFGLDHS